MPSDHRLSLFTLSVATSLLLLSLSCSPPQVEAHSWIDCIDHSYDVTYTNSAEWVLTGEKGHGVCEGYAYGYPGRGSPTINTDFTKKLLPEDILNDSTHVCQFQQSEAGYGDWRRAIHAGPGDTLYFAYMPNGHIVRDSAGVNTTYGIYWSGLPDVQLQKASELTAERLITGSTAKFDDGNCGETGTTSGEPSGRAGDYKPCIGNFTIPDDTPEGTYPMVWFWTFYTEEDYANGFATFRGAGGAAYSSCFDVVVETNATPSPSP